MVDEENMSARVKTFLGLTRHKPAQDHVITQFEHALRVNLTNGSTEYLDEVNRLYFHIYKFLQDICKEDQDMCEMIRSAFGQRHCVIIDKHIVKPEQVAFVFPHHGAPYLFGLPDDMARKFPELMRHLGVRDRFQVNDFVQALGTMHDEYGDRKMDEKHAATSVTLTGQLNESMKYNGLNSQQVEEQYGAIYLPSAANILKPASSLCYNDCPWVTNTESMEFTHPGITLTSSDKLGVRTKRQEALQKHATGIPFGQKERLVNSLNRVLTNYPLDQEVLKGRSSYSHGSIKI